MKTQCKRWLYFTGVLVLGIIFFIICSLIFKLKPAGKCFDLNETGIVLSIISAFIAILIPLHYSLVLDIIDKLKNGYVKNADDKITLKIYIAASDIIVYITALFGISTLAEGAISIGVNKEIIKNQHVWEKSVGFIFLLAVYAAIWRSMIIINNNKIRKSKYFIYYIIWIIVATFDVLIWAKEMIMYNSSHNMAFIGIISLSGLYSLWLLLKFPFIPINRVGGLFENENKEN